MNLIFILSIIQAIGYKNILIVTAQIRYLKNLISYTDSKTVAVLRKGQL